MIVLLPELSYNNVKITIYTVIYGWNKLLLRFLLKKKYILMWYTYYIFMTDLEIMVQVKVVLLEWSIGKQGNAEERK